MAFTDSSEWSLMAKPPVVKPGSLMLKDYLRDEMSSCSSNGFRSFPRRQCCTTTVRFLLEIDLKVKDSSVTKRFLPRTASRKLALSTISTLQRASDAVVKAFKQLPFHSVKTASPSAKDRIRKPFLPRSLSRKLLLGAFRKKAEMVDPNIRRWKSFQEFLDEKEPPSSHQNRSDSATCTAITVAVRNSTTSCSNSFSWTESEFASEMIPSSSGNSESSSENDAVKDQKDSPGTGNLIGKREGVTFGKDSMEEATAAAAAATAYLEQIAKQQWPSEEEREQFSPVSVLDFPFDDEDQDISSSSFNLHLIEGKKQKHTQKMKRFQNGAELEPLDLQKRFADLGLRRELGLISTKEHQRVEKAFELLKLVKSTTKSQCFIFKTENLLLDFFHEKLEEIEAIADESFRRRGDFEAQVMKLTEDWIDGEGGEMMLMAWELPEGRSLYVKDMEKAGKWRSFAGEIEELASEFEAEVWISLLDELLIDLS